MRSISTFFWYSKLVFLPILLTPCCRYQCSSYAVLLSQVRLQCLAATQTRRLFKKLNPVAFTGATLGVRKECEN